MRTVIFILVCQLHSQGMMAQDIDYVKTIAESLSAPEMKGRGYVGGGLEMAGDFIANEFDALGLLPLESSYFQSFSHQVNIFPGELEVKVKGETLRPGVDYLIDPASPALHGVFTAHILTSLNLKELASPAVIDKECEDCILIFDMSNIEDDLLEKRMKRMVQLYADHVPVISVSREKFTWSVASSQRPFPIIKIQPGLIREGDFISINMEAEIQADFESRNVMGLVKGTLYPDSFIFMTAHYDHLGMMGKDACFYGANDNASGVAVMMSLAKHYVAEPGPYTMVFVAFAGEEAGLLGSKHFVDHRTVDLQKLRLLVNMDLMGSGVDGIMVVNGKENPDLMGVLKKENEAKAYLPKVGTRSQVANSDHYYFAEAGVPAVFIYALGGSSAYHDVFDVFENLTFEEYPDIFRLITHLNSTY